MDDSSGSRGNSSGGGSRDDSSGSRGNSGSRVGNGNRLDMSGDNGGSRVGGVGVVVDTGLLNNLVDGVDLVGGGDGDGSGNLNGVGLVDVLGDEDLSLDGDGDLDRDINVVLVDLELGNNLGLDRGDSGVSSHGSSDLLLDNGVSGGWSSGDGCRGDGSK